MLLRKWRFLRMHFVLFDFLFMGESQELRRGKWLYPPPKFRSQIFFFRGEQSITFFRLSTIKKSKKMCPTIFMIFLDLHTHTQYTVLFHLHALKINLFVYNLICQKLLHYYWKYILSKNTFVSSKEIKVYIFIHLIFFQSG